MKRDISIEDLLIWTYRDQWAWGGFASDYREPSGVSADGCAMVEWIAQLGCMPDRGPSMWGLTSPDRVTDAGMVATAVRLLCKGATFDLVTHHARIGGRPDWKPTARHRLEPLGFVTLQKAKPAWRATAGETVAQTENWYDPDDRREYPCCPLIEMDTPDITEYHRAMYAEWWRALDLLRSILVPATGLTRYRITPAMPPEHPWRDDHELSRATARFEQCA